jgi:hypothetical protein
MTEQTITKITVTDFMGIGGTIELFPEGALVQIAGPNGSGKSSLIHAIEECIDPQGTRIIPKPIHEGATEARVEIETTEARIVRVWKKDDAGTLSAYALDGAKYPSGKAFVAEVTGGILFDPDDFVKLSEKEQRDQLLAMVTLPFDLDEITAKRKGFFDGRTDKSREVKRLAAQLAGFAPADASVPAEEVSAAALVKELDEIREHNTRVDGLSEAWGRAEADRVRVEEQGRELAAALDKARADHKLAVAAEKAAEKELSTAERKSPDAVTEQLANIDDVNAKVRAQVARAALAAELADRTAEEAGLNASIDAIDKTKADGLAAAAFPAGLSLGDTGIVHNGIPFRQLNSAAQDTIALDLVTSAKPALKVVVMKSGDRLDDVRLEGYRALAVERGFMVFMERDRGSSREVGFTIPGAVSS